MCAVFVGDDVPGTATGVFTHAAASSTGVAHAEAVKPLVHASPRRATLRSVGGKAACFRVKEGNCSTAPTLLPSATLLADNNGVRYILWLWLRQDHLVGVVKQSHRQLHHTEILAWLTPRQ
jgi:hypothetical protein